MSVPTWSINIFIFRRMYARKRLNEKLFFSSFYIKKSGQKTSSSTLKKIKKNIKKRNQRCELYDVPNRFFSFTQNVSPVKIRWLLKFLVKYRVFPNFPRYMYKPWEKYSPSWAFPEMTGTEINYPLVKIYGN